MSERLTDRVAIAIALRMAIDYEDSLIDAYSNVTDSEKEEGVIIARRNIAAFKRVQQRYGLGVEKRPDGGKPVSIFEILKSIASEPS